MPRPRFNPVESWWDVLARAGWCGLAAVHAPVLVRVGGRLIDNPEWPAAARWLVLLLSLAFFAAKVAGLRVLPGAPRRAGIVAFMAACGLLHSQVREEVFAHPGNGMVAVVSAGAVLGAPAIRRLMAGGTAAGALLPAGAWAIVCIRGARAARPVLCGLAAVPRGPPRA